METISLQELIAINNTPKAKALIIKYGYDSAENIEDLVYKLFMLTKDYKEEALKELSELHPHKDLIINFQEPKKCECDEKIKSIISRFNNKKFSNFEYADEYIDFQGGKKNKELAKDYLPLILVAGVFALAITSIVKK